MDVSGWYSYLLEKEIACSQRGIPVPHTGVKSWRSKKSRAGKPNGVSANSRIASFYDDEGEKGPVVRRTIRRKEKALWLSESE